MLEFVSETVLKRDIFSETHKGHYTNDPGTPIIRRIITRTPLWSRPLAWILANREIRGLKAVKDIAGTPQLISTDRDGLFRNWSEGTPLHLARPGEALWYRDAFRLLREMRRANITHNDLAKPQNWLMTPDGRAAVIDFQLASSHRRRGRLYKLLAYEDFRHLLKQMRAFAPERMTPTGKRILARRSLPSRMWMATGKKLYNLVTRGIFNWSDGEGTKDRIDREGPTIISTLGSQPGVRSVVLAPFPMPSKGVGIYAYVEADASADMAAVTAGIADMAAASTADLVQTVASLPRRPDGSPRSDILQMIAMNQMTELDALLDGDTALAAIVRPIAAGRLNFSDRRITRLEPKN